MTKLCQIKGYTNVKAIRPFHEFKLIYSKYVYVYKYILYMCVFISQKYHNNQIYIKNTE